MRPGEAWHAAIFRFVRNFTPENSCVDLVLRDLAWFQLIYWLPVTLFNCSRRFTIWSKQPAAETAARSRCSIRYWTVSLQSMYSLYLHRKAPKSDQKNFTFQNPQQIQTRTQTRQPNLPSLGFMVEAFVVRQLKESFMLSFSCKVTGEALFGCCSQE